MTSESVDFGNIEWDKQWNKEGGLMYYKIYNIPMQDIPTWQAPDFNGAENIKIITEALRAVKEGFFKNLYYRPQKH